MLSYWLAQFSLINRPSLLAQGYSVDAGGGFHTILTIMVEILLKGCKTTSQSFICTLQYIVLPCDATCSSAVFHNVQSQYLCKRYSQYICKSEALYSMRQYR